jgi:hypothetical protein
LSKEGDFRGTGKAAAFGNSNKNFQLFQIHAQPLGNNATCVFMDSNEIRLLIARFYQVGKHLLVSGTDSPPGTRVVA